jgi:hypothetical protein
MRYRYLLEVMRASHLPRVDQEARGSGSPGCCAARKLVIWEQTSDLVRSQAALGSGIVVSDRQALLSL